MSHPSCRRTAARPSLLAEPSWLAVILIAAMLAAGSPAAVAGLDSQFNPSTWITNGPVYAIAKGEGVVYVGGWFSYIGPNTGSGSPIDLQSGLPLAHSSQVTGIVRACVADGEGGWIIGGDFTKVGALWRSNLARIRADGTVDPHWNPIANGTVNALAVSGATVYVGGHFTKIGALSRNCLAALNNTDGTPTNWNPNPNAPVMTILAADSMIYVGGAFTTIGGVSRQRLAQLDPMTGAATDWSVDANGTVLTIVRSSVTPTIGSLLVGGEFTTIGGKPRSYLAAISLGGVVQDWNPGPSGTVRALVATTTGAGAPVVYVGGEFSKVGGKLQRGLAAFDASGSLLDWDPLPDSSVSSLALVDNKLLVGGDFTTMGGLVRDRLAQFDLSTGLPTQLDLSFNASVLTLAASGATCYVGGSFVSIGGVERKNLAALDTQTGRATAWNPDIGYTIEMPRVLALAATSTTLYVGGHFDSMSGQTRNGIGALDLESGLPTSWNPGSNGSVGTLHVSGSTVYASGGFTEIGGKPRERLAALDTHRDVNNAIDWNPISNGLVHSLAFTDSTIYVGGDFTSIGGKPRNHIAAIDKLTGMVSDWNPAANKPVYDIELSGSTVIAGGVFDFIGGKTRQGLAAIDAVSGEATDWAPDAMYGVWDSIVPMDFNTIYQPPSRGAVYAIGLARGLVLAGGNYTLIGGQSRNMIAAMTPGDDGTRVTGWNPGAGGLWYGPPQINAILSLDDSVYIFGQFSTINGSSCPHIARFDWLPNHAHDWMHHK